MTAGQLTGTSIHLALAGTVAIGPAYLSGLIAAGPGEHQFTYETPNGSRKGTGQQQIIRERLALGMVGDRLFGALTLNNEAPSYILKYMTLEMSRFEIGAMLGVKF